MSQNNKIKEKLGEVVRITEELERRKALYEELDNLTLELREAGFTAGDYDTGCGEILSITLVDNFAEKNTQFRMAALRRYEIKVKPARAAGGTAGKKRKKGG